MNNFAGVCMSIDYKKIGGRISFARKKLHLTQEEVSSRVGIGIDFYAHIESGTSCSLSVLIRILQVLNISCDYVLAGIIPAAKYILDDEFAYLLEQCTDDQIAALKVVAEAFAKSNKE